MYFYQIQTCFSIIEMALDVDETFGWPPSFSSSGAFVNGKPVSLPLAGILNTFMYHLYRFFCGYGCYSNGSHNGIARVKLVKLSKIRDVLGGRRNNREVLEVNRRLLDDSGARVNLRVTLILLLFRNIIGCCRLILIDYVTVDGFLFTGSYSLFARL